MDDLKTCACGCGTTIEEKNTWCIGHHIRAINGYKHPKLCLCGCGELAKSGNDYVHGHYIRVWNPMDNPETVDKLRGDNNPSKRPEVRKLISEKLTGYKHTEEAVKNMTKAQMERKERDPELWYEMSVKGGINMQEMYPCLSSKVFKETHKNNPGFWSEIAKETNRKWKESNPDDYYRKKQEYAKLMLEERMRQKEENPELFREVCIEASIKGRKKARENVPHMWNNVGFLSKMEMECAKLILNEPLDGVNCHVRIDRKIIDFFPQIGDKFYIGCFVEYHPWDWDGLTTEEYYQQRKEVIENSEYKGTELIVITDLKEIKNG